MCQWDLINFFFFKRADVGIQTKTMTGKWPLKARHLAFLLWHTAAIFEDCPPWVRSHNKLSCALVLGGPFRQERVSLGRQVPIPGIATWGSLSLCSSETWQREMGALETREIYKSGACLQLLGGRMPPLSSLCETLHLQQLGLAGAFHALKSQKRKEEGVLQKEMPARHRFYSGFVPRINTDVKVKKQTSKSI